MQAKTQQRYQAVTRLSHEIWSASILEDMIHMHISKSEWRSGASTTTKVTDGKDLAYCQYDP